MEAGGIESTSMAALIRISHNNGLFFQALTRRIPTPEPISPNYRCEKL
jgi:hypothetical protein